MPEDLLAFLKIIADKTRLNIIGLLTERPYSGDELAAVLQLNPSTVSQHINRMRKVGLIHIEVAQYYNLYSVDFERFDAYVKQLTAGGLAERVRTSDDIDHEAYHQQILDHWMKDGSIQGVPSQIQHRPVLLNWLLNRFELDKAYEPQQVADVLAAYCSPKVQADWRKLLVKAKKLSHTPDKTLFWRTDSPLAHQPDFSPQSLPLAALPPEIQAPRWRGGRLTISRDPELHKRNLLAIALRLVKERPYSAAEIDQLTTTYSEGNPAALRQQLIDKEVIHLQEDGTFLRDPIGPDHPIWQ